MLEQQMDSENESHSSSVLLPIDYTEGKEGGAGELWL